MPSKPIEPTIWESGPYVNASLKFGDLELRFSHYPGLEQDMGVTLIKDNETISDTGVMSSDEFYSFIETWTNHPSFLFNTIKREAA